MDQTMPVVTTKAALLRLADAFQQVWNRGRDALAAADALEASFAEEERRLGQLRKEVDILAAEHERLAEPLAALEAIRKRIKKDSN
jgi:cell division protein FtsB